MIQDLVEKINKKLEIKNSNPNCLNVLKCFKMFKIVFKCFKMITVPNSTYCSFHTGF